MLTTRGQWGLGTHPLGTWAVQESISCPAWDLWTQNLKWSVPKRPSGGTIHSCINLSQQEMDGTLKGILRSFRLRDSLQRSGQGYGNLPGMGPRGLTLRKPLQFLGLMGKRRQLLLWEGTALPERQPLETTAPGRQGPGDKYDLDPARASLWPNGAASRNAPE